MWIQFSSAPQNHFGQVRHPKHYPAAFMVYLYISAGLFLDLAAYTFTGLISVPASGSVPAVNDPATEGQ